MKKPILILSISILSFLLTCFLVVRGKNLAAPAPNFERIYKNDAIRLVRSFEMPFDVLDLKIYDQRFFVLNRSDQQIVELDTMGNVVARWGKRGGAPAEFQHIIGWDVDRQGVYVLDVRRLAITELTFEGSVVAYYPVRSSFVRGHRLAAKHYVLKAMSKDSPRRQAFLLIDISTDSTTVMKSPFPEVPNDIAFDGVFVKNNVGRNFYVSHWASFFFSFDATGKQLYTAETIDRTPPPTILEQSGAMGMDPKATLVNISMSANERHLYILSRARSRAQEDKGAVDLYDVRNGKYEYSFLIPGFKGEYPRIIAVGENQFLAFQGEAIVHYRFQDVRQK
ncbi:MAG: hypothetical protein FJ215_01380 [Ignavibacteria bacterium]|nr:hypothetical protein [Ignavibacteria bacterium]